MAPESESESSWTVTFRLEPEELKTAHRAYMRGRYPRQPIYVAVLFMIFGAGVGSFVGMAADRSRPMAMTIGAGLGLLLLWWIIRRFERDVIRRSEQWGLFTEQTLTLKPEGFDHTFEDGRNYFRPWRTVRKLGKSPLHLVFFIDQEHSALFVPLRAFESRASADLFLVVAQHWHAKATA